MDLVSANGNARLDAMNYDDFSRKVLRTFLVFMAIAAGPSCPLARADGGDLRFSGMVGPYSAAIFTLPAEIQPGPVDVSVLIQDPSTQKPVSDAKVKARLFAQNDDYLLVESEASIGAATNKLMQAATLIVPKAGRYRIEVFIVGPLGSGRENFEIEAAHPLICGVEFLGWVGWPFGAMGLFLTHQWLVQKRIKR